VKKALKTVKICNLTLGLLLALLLNACGKEESSDTDVTTNAFRRQRSLQKLKVA